MTATTGLGGRVALVTGANHGIGAATAVSLARVGAAVLVTYLALGVPPTLASQTRIGATERRTQTR
jgi:NAD(P)-dependent dehydrogenase (short-subunit alcohol dehydrogenase family)